MSHDVVDTKASEKKPKRSKSKSKLKGKEVDPAETAHSNPGIVTPPAEGALLIHISWKWLLNILGDGTVESQDEKAKRKEEKKRKKKERKEKEASSGSATPAVAEEDAMQVDFERVYSCPVNVFNNFNNK